MKINDIHIGDVFEGNYGKYKIIEILDKDKNRRMHYKIQFLLTGYIKETTNESLGHNIYDPYYPSMFGCACIGEPEIPIRECKTFYNRWHSMISRCYNVNDKDYNKYGGIGITVDTRWHCFANYLYDIKFIDGYHQMILNPSAFNLDKDIKQSHIPINMRVYSKDTCIWVSATENQSQRANDNINKQYRDISKKCNIYTVRITINGERRTIGKYTNPIYAANHINYVRKLLGQRETNPNIPYIPIEEVLKQNLNQPINLINII